VSAVPCSGIVGQIRSWFPIEVLKSAV
jgi:hypothetical protein